MYNCLAVALATGLSPAVAQAQNLFVSDYGSGNIYEFTPGGVQSTFASGLSGPAGLAFDSSGNLYDANAINRNIYKFTPGGTRSTFASGLNYPYGLALTARAICLRRIPSAATYTNSRQVERAAPLPPACRTLLV